MRVAIDAIPLLLRCAGVKTYLYNWISHLRTTARDAEVLAFPFLHSFREFSHERSVVGPVSTWARIAFLLAGNYSPVSLFDWFGPKIDIFHASHQMRNPPRKCRLTATIYDMTCWLMPEMHSRANVAANHVFIDRIAKRADGLIAISENTRQDLIRLAGVRPERVKVIYPGLSEAYFNTTPDSAHAARAKFGLSRPYVAAVGTIEPRKNVDRLLDAWNALAPDVRNEYELVLAGPIGWAEPRTIARLRSGASGVRYLGYVSDADLPGLTRGASAFAYLSLYEGFGLPVGEAMAAGVPVVTSAISSMPEVAGGAALLADPRSTGEIRGALDRLLCSVSLRAELSARGRKVAERYRWDRCAVDSWRFFESLGS